MAGHERGEHSKHHEVGEQGVEVEQAAMGHEKRGCGPEHGRAQGELGAHEAAQQQVAGGHGEGVGQHGAKPQPGQVPELIRGGGPAERHGQLLQA